MNFAEERTPSELILKIMFNKFKYLVFNNKGESIFADSEGRNLLHKMPSIIFLGNTFEIERDYDREYSLLKMRENHLIVPYRNIIEKKKKYIFIIMFAMSDIVPCIIRHVKGYSSMLRDVPQGTEIDYLVVDDTLSETEISVIASRFKPSEIINISSQRFEEPQEEKGSKEQDFININTMSENAVFLALYHLKNMALSNLNQLLLDFEISAFDTQYIIFFLNDLIEKRGGESDVVKNRNMLMDLKSSFEFYLALIERNETAIKDILTRETDYKKLAPYRTLVSKVSSMNPGREGQLLYTEYENLVMDRLEELRPR